MSSERYVLSVREIVSDWVGEGVNVGVLERLRDVEVGSSDIVEIIGRANGGKSYFCFQFIYYCLRKGLTVIFLDSN